MQQNGLKTREDTDGQNRVVSDTYSMGLPNKRSPPPRLKTGQQLDYWGIQCLIFASSASGESPPLPPRAFFGRDELMEKIVGFAGNLTPTVLIGVGGIGKTSIALTVLHDNRIKQRFGDDRRFIRCDKFPASLTHFLRRLSNAIGAGIENPDDLSLLRPFLSSKEMFIVLDNAESILDSRGMNAQEIYDVVEELSQLNNICLCITSRISTVPPDCEWIDVPTLTMEAARDTFYRIYKHDKRSDPINNILEQLEFHPLSITLLATVAHQNRWDAGQLVSEWDERRTDMLQTEHNKSLSVAIELSLSSAMFRELGPEARDLLGVVAFFPRGVDEKNLDWLFPTIPGRKKIFNKFHVLSLTYRSKGFITMLAPLRDHLRPKDPKSSPLLCMTKDHYFGRLSVQIDPNGPDFGETRWIVSEDVNAEYLLDVFTTIDASSRNVWDACSFLINHLYWHKPRLTVLGPRIEELPDDHPCKPSCLHRLSLLFGEIGNNMGCKRVLTHTLQLWRGQGDDHRVAEVLRDLSDVNRLLGLRKEGIECAEEALKICERLGDTTRQARCLDKLAWLFYDDKQLDAAEEAASRALDLFPEKGDESQVSSCHGALGNTYRSKGEIGVAIHHFETALEMASSFGWDDHLFWTHYDLAELENSQDKFDDANAHVERAKSYSGSSAYYLAAAMDLQAKVWYKQDRFEEAKSEVLRAIDGFEKLGATQDVNDTKDFLRQIEAAMNNGKSQKWRCF